MPDRPMLIIDGHLDLAFNALHHRRDLTQDVCVLREREDPKPPGPSHPDSLRDRKRPESTSRGTATVSLPADAPRLRRHRALDHHVPSANARRPPRRRHEDSRSGSLRRPIASSLLQSARARGPTALHPRHKRPRRGHCRLAKSRLNDSDWPDTEHGKRRSHLRS